MVIDTGPAADAAARRSAELADLVLIPCRPSAFDLKAIRTTLDLVEATRTPAFVVLKCGAAHFKHERRYRHADGKAYAETLTKIPYQARNPLSSKKARVQATALGDCWIWY